MTQRSTKRRPRRSLRRLAGPSGLLLLSASTLLACTAILGIEDAQLIEGAGGQGAGGGTGGCQDAEDCDDDNRCTIDECDTETGECSNQSVPDGPAPTELQLPGDCLRVICSSGTPDTEPDDTDLPDDDNQCTDDVCTDGAPSNPQLPAHTECDQLGGHYCNSAGVCVECTNHDHCTLPLTCGGGGEPYVCGCTPEVCDTLSCGFGDDLKCDTGIKDCNNDAQDGDETDVDCGGTPTTCSLRCQAGDDCLQPTDCASANCMDCGGGLRQCDDCGAGGAGGGG